MTNIPNTDSRSPELLHQSDRTKVVRVHPSGGVKSMIRKELLGPLADQRLRHEVTILQRLAGTKGVSQMVGTRHEGSNAIFLEDERGAALSETLLHGALETVELFDMAQQLTAIVVAVHRQGVVHKDINPTNIIVGPDRSLTLIDFGLATTFAEERPGFTHESEIAGTLAYLAPEQTGRTGGRVDQRSDLYALGATLYELATGHCPFEHTDMLQLIHDHLARVPIAPR